MFTSVSLFHDENFSPFGHDLPRFSRRARPLWAEQVQSTVTYLWNCQNYEPVLDQIDQRFREFDATAYEEDFPHRDLGDLGITATLLDMPDEELLQFGSWNLSRAHDLRSHLRRDTPLLHERALARAAGLVSAGVYPAHATDAFEVSLRAHGAIGQLDSFNSGTNGAYGLCRKSGRPRLFLANLYDNPATLEGLKTNGRLSEVAFHEFMHNSGFTNPDARGFLEAQDNLPPLRWLEEAIVTHAAVVSSDSSMPNPSIINPHERSLAATGSYTDERELLGLLCHPALGNIPVDLIYSAYFSPLESKARLELLRRLLHAFDTLYPNDTSPLRAFTRTYNQLSASEMDKAERRRHVKLTSTAALKYLNDQREIIFEDEEPRQGLASMLVARLA